MGDFRIVIESSGGHGCQREVKDGGEVYGCNRLDCPDCLTREFTQLLKNKGMSPSKALFIHWPADFKNADGTRPYTKEGEVTDDLLTRKRTGSFP